MSQPSTAAPQHDLLEKLADVGNRAKSFTSAGGAVVAIASGTQFLVCATVGTSLDAGVAVPLPGTFTGFRAQKSNVLRCPDTDKDVTIDGRVCHAARIKSMLVAPVGDLSSVRAVLAVFSSAVNAFSETHVAVLKTLAEVVGNLLPDKEKLAELLPPRSAEAILDHPFNPAIDQLGKTAEAVFPVQRFGEPAKLPGMPTSSAGKATARVPIQEPYKPAVTPEPKMPAPPAPQVAAPVPSALSSKSLNEVLNIAADPLAGRVVVTPPPARTTSYRTAGRISRSKSYKKIYAALWVALLASVLAWVGYGYFSRTDAATSESSSIAPTGTTPEQTLGSASSNVIPDPAPPIRSDVVSTANAANVPVASRAPASSQAASAPRDEEAPRVQAAEPQPIVVSQGAKATRTPLIKLQEEPPPDAAVANVAGPSTAINDILKAPSAASTPALKRSQIVPGELISSVAPAYPPNAKRYGFFGAVVVSAKINKDGSVSNVRQVSGNPVLGDAAIAAVKRWRYKPALSDGTPIESTVQITVNFNQPK